VYFRELHQRLIDVARERVRAGEFTERGLARIAGVSQPHMHNVLKGIRSLSADAADRLLRALRLSIPDPIWKGSGTEDTSFRAIPILRSRIGPGSEANFSVFRGHAQMEETLLQGVVSPVAARLAPDLVLPRELAANDLVLLDQNPAIRARPDEQSYWVVADRTGLRVRYLRTSGGRLHAASEANLGDPGKWQPLPLQGRNILEIVRARIVWFSRKVEKEPAGPAEPAGEID
jgi:hypothetical protein